MTGAAGGGVGEHRFASRTCSAPAERVARMSAVVLGAVDPAAVRRVLDVGCGTGAQVRALAERLPAAELTGIDVSAANIAAADAARTGHPAAGRMAFARADYLRFAAPPFDLVVSDGVLHLVAAPDAALAARLAADVAPGGVLVVAMASDCLYNRLFASVRRVLRKVQSPVVDAAILGIARVLHGRQMNDVMLRERVHYMYLPPTRLMNEGFKRALREQGLTHVATQPMPRTSPSQLVHAVDVFRRAASGGRPEA